jgi:hypothetical protein
MDASPSNGAEAIDTLRLSQFMMLLPFVAVSHPKRVNPISTAQTTRIDNLRQTTPDISQRSARQKKKPRPLLQAALGRSAIVTHGIKSP